jgi:hypothetical protein
MKINTGYLSRFELFSANTNKYMQNTQTSKRSKTLMPPNRNLLNPLLQEYRSKQASLYAEAYSW